VKDQRALFKNIGHITDPAKIKMYQERCALLAQAGFVFDETLAKAGYVSDEKDLI
jgi:hypothetical protein